MTGMDGFCAYKEVVQVAAAAINKRKSRRLAPPWNVAALELAYLILTNPLASVVGQSISHDAQLVATDCAKRPQVGIG